MPDANLPPDPFTNPDAHIALVTFAEAREIPPGHSVLILLQDCGHDDCMRHTATHLHQWAERGGLNLVVLSHPAVVEVLTPTDVELIDNDPSITIDGQDPRLN